MKNRGQVIATRRRQIQQILISMLREIFDESAYARFLARQGMTASRETYAEFIREQGEAKARRPKCC